MKTHFQTFAAYNHWANARLFAAVMAQGDLAARRPIGLFFGSLHGTLNHLLLTDRMWLGRLTGEDPEAGPLDRIVRDDFPGLVADRIAQDRRLIATIDAYPPDAFAAAVTYENTSGARFLQPLGDVLSHLFNHQTHHRAQAHTGLSLIGAPAPPGLDLLLFQRGVAAPGPDELLAQAAAL